MKYIVSFGFGLSLAAALAGCSSADRNRAEEKRILSEINELSEKSRKRITSESLRATMVRLNDLRQRFPDKRSEIARDASEVKSFFIGAIDEDSKIIEQYKKLLALRLAPRYEDCVKTQIQLQESTIVQSQSVVEEMSLLSDLSIKDRPTLDSKVEAIRIRRIRNDENRADLEAIVNGNCKGPGSNSFKQ